MVNGRGGKQDGKLMINVEAVREHDNLTVEAHGCLQFEEYFLLMRFLLVQFVLMMQNGICER